MSYSDLIVTATQFINEKKYDEATKELNALLESSYLRCGVVYA